MFYNTIYKFKFKRYKETSIRSIVVCGELQKYRAQVIQYDIKKYQRAFLPCFSKGSYDRPDVQNRVSQVIGIIWSFPQAVIDRIDVLLSLLQQLFDNTNSGHQTSKIK